ncbi:hypothetical protein ACC759_38655, partial [Rhizobium ruizarguesonis]
FVFVLNKVFDIILSEEVLERCLGLLTNDFLGVLPNAQDQLGKGYGYELIRNAITEAMNTEPLFPTHGKGHAPANKLVQ